MLSYKDAVNDDARIYWTLQDGSMSLNGIYATLRHLRSQISKNELLRIINQHVKDGNLIAIAHPTHKNEFFYRLSPDVLNTKQQ